MENSDKKSIVWSWAKTLQVLGLMSVGIVIYETFKYVSRDKDLDSIILIE